ncbi:MAG TPA: BatD family protein [Chthoniobacterales bacterium]|nr:BatD family protein [Chthoniobacterales bacterium]
MEIHTRHFTFGLTLVTLMVTTAVASAASPNVTAVLSNSEPAVGEAVQLQIKVSGAQSANVPEEISVEGLEIHQTGTSRQFEMHNFDVTSSVLYNYAIVPSRAGKFIIPAQTVRVGSDSLRTPELTLDVASDTGHSAGTPRGNQAQSGLNKIAFAELVVAKKDAYVGEMVPAEIRLAFEPRSHPRLQEGPELSGQGFTTQKLQQPQENMETIGGRTYQVLTFKTAISPARSGKFEIGPVQAKAVVVLPRRPSAPRTGRPRSPFDLFNLDDPFSDPFFADPFGSMGERIELPIKSESVMLNVKPLPPNAPPSFSGAIGNFTMSVDAKPKNVQVGDPITVTATVSGRGNFDRMSGPALEDERGWHKYPPSAKFKQDDDVGISGEKTFETVIAPNEKKTAVPPLTFAYFDPVKEDYVTLRSDPLAIAVEGGAAPAPTVAAASAAPNQSAPARVATPAPVSKPADILYQLNDLGAVRSFAPIYARPAFWTIQLAPLIVLLGFAGWKIRHEAVGNREVLRVAALQQESADLLRKLRRAELSPQEYFSNASRVARVKTALAKNIDPNAVDAETIARTFDLNENERARLRTLFARTDELRYSGTGNGDKNLPREDREEVLGLLESLHS